MSFILSSSIIPPSPSSFVTSFPFGIDFGTTYSLISRGTQQDVQVLTPLIPSVVFYEKKTSPPNPEESQGNFFFSELYKCLYESPLYEKDLYELLSCGASYKPKENNHNSEYYFHDFFHGGQEYRGLRSMKRLLSPEKAHEPLFGSLTPFHVTKDFFQRLFLLTQKIMKEKKEEQQDILETIITVPAYFSESQRQLIKKAAEASSWKVLRLLSEPSAAALDYLYGSINANNNGTNNNNHTNEHKVSSAQGDGLYGVYDSGSINTNNNGVNNNNHTNEHKVSSAQGDDLYGVYDSGSINTNNNGSNNNNHTNEHKVSSAQEDGLYGVYDLGGGTFDISLLKRKGPLCRVLQTKGHGALGGDDLDVLFAQCFQVSLNQGRFLKEDFSKEFSSLSITKDISLQDFQNINDNNHRHLWNHLAQCLKNYGSSKGYVLSQDFLDTLIQGVKDFFYTTWQLVKEILKESSLRLKDLKAFILTGGSSRFPFFYEALRQNLHLQCPLVVADFHQSVSKGAALHGKNLLHNHQFLFLDVVPLSLGIETLGGLVERLIPRGSPLPAKGKMSFTTGKDYQQALYLHVVQGEGELVDHCFSLGHLDIPIPPEPKGHVKIDIVFSLNDDGLLSLQVTRQGQNQEETPLHMDCWTFEHLQDKVIEKQIAQEGQDLFQRWWKDLEQKIQEGLKEIYYLLDHKGKNLQETENIRKNVREIEAFFKDRQKILQEGASEEDYLKIFQMMKEEWENFNQGVMDFLNQILQQELLLPHEGKYKKVNLH